MTHTKGIWMAKDGQIYTEETGKTIALVPYYDKEDEEQTANLKLIAAAPAMLNALKKAVEVIERMSDEYSAIADRHASYTVGEGRIIEGAIREATE